MLDLRYCTLTPLGELYTRISLLEHLYTTELLEYRISLLYHGTTAETWWYMALDADIR